jgi:hypothetical protein
MLNIDQRPPRIYLNINGEPIRSDFRNFSSAKAALDAILLQTDVTGQKRLRKHNDIIELSLC